MENNQFEIIERVKDFNTFYFIESHLDQLNNDLEVVLDSSYKCLKPLRKINEKKIKDQKNKNLEYIVSIYAIDFKPSLIKKKEIKEIDRVSYLPIKLFLKSKKNKFESKNNIRIDCDTFNTNVKYEMQKKLFGKDIYPPEQIQLSNLEIIQIFNDTLLIKEKMKIEDITYFEFLKFCIGLFKNMETIELNLYYMIYINILNGPNTQLLKEIIDLFNMNKLVKPLKSDVLAPYLEKIEILFDEQNKVIEKIKKIPNIDCKIYIYKFYTINLYLYSIIENYESCERMMLDLRDKNTYDNLILPKLYLSEYSNFYRNIPISIDLQNSLMGKFIDISSNYNELVNAFLLISDYNKKNFATILLIITQNYDKINGICRQSNCPLNIIDFISQNQNDDLFQIQNHLEFITNKKIENHFKSINFNLNIWDFYLSNGNNQSFFEFLKNNLIIGSLCYDEIIESLVYLIKYTNKNFIEMLDLIVKNYDKFRSICMNERRQIIINDFIEPSINDNPEKIKECLSFIVSQKLKDLYETVFFNINIWNFYIFNHYQFEFLSFLEMKLYESALNSKEILDCLIFSSNFVNKSFQYMVEKILYNFDKIQSLFKRENIFIDIQNYIVQQPNDDLGKIYDSIKAIIEKEILNAYCSIRFNPDLWILYSNAQSLDTLKFLRKIMNECKKMQPELDEEKIQLSTKIHYVGFLEIQKGILTGDKLLQFLGEDEAFYADKRINECMKKIDFLQNRIDSQENKIKDLEIENNQFKKNINDLTNENSNLKHKINNLENEQRKLGSKISNVENNCHDLERKIRNLQTSP